MGGAKSPPPPPAYDPGVGYKAQLKYTPKLLRAEEAARAQYEPIDAQRAADIFASTYQQSQPLVAKTNLATLKQIDPESIAARKQLYGRVTEDLGRGTALDPQFAAQVQQNIRGAQAARGNVLGDAPIAAEALFEGQAGQALYQQRLDNAQNFLRAPTPEDHFGALLGGAGAGGGGSVGGGNGGNSNISTYYNPEISNKLGLQDYQSRENAYSRLRPPSNPWNRVLVGAAAGASTGFTFGGVYGALGGAIGGAVEGGLNTGWGVGGSAAARV